MPPSRHLCALSVLAALGLAACTETTVPDVVPPPLDAPLASVSAGVLHSCGVTTTNQVYCWGWNRDGELGNNSTTDSRYPQHVLGGLSFAAATAGGGHSCGVTTTRVGYCWGFNLTGQLGDGSTASHATPLSVSSGSASFALESVEAGGAYTCALAADSTAYCWGWDGTGQLGAAASGSCATSSGPTPCSREPVALAGKFTAISAGTLHTCAIAADSTAFCWGRNGFGQLGDNSQVDATVPVAVQGGLKFTMVTVGFQHSCGLTAAGDAYCWGDNSEVQLGDPLVGSSAVPNLVPGGQVFVQLSAGAAFTCGVSVIGAGYCWGANGSGQLGSESPALCTLPSGQSLPCTPEPKLLSGGLSFTAISAGTQHSCGVTTGQVAYCWGFNDRGQLGDGSTFSSGAPIRVANQP